MVLIIVKLIMLLILNYDQLATFNCYFLGYCVHGIPVLDSSKLLHGRPNRGVLMICPHIFGAKAKFIPTP